MAYEFPLVGVIILLTVVVYALYKKLGEARFGKNSLAVKYGKMSEQFFPFLEKYPHDPENFRFLGTPVDGIQFDKDRIVFVEFKTGDSRLSTKQKEVRELIKSKKIEFREVRIK